MSDELIPENQEPAPVSVPDPRQMALPFAAPVDQPAQTCASPGCGKPLDPVNFKIDANTNEPLCDEHAVQCYECHQWHSLEYLTPYTYPGHRDPVWFCSTCFGNSFATCPNCDETVPKDEYLAPTSANRFSMKQGGCSNCSCRCSSCERVVDNDYVLSYGDAQYCEDCYSEYYTNCEHCGDTIDRDGANYVEDVGDFCDSCYNDKYGNCHECNKSIEKDAAYEYNEEWYCEDCYQQLGPEEYSDYTEEFKEFSYTKKDRYLNLLYKLLPISVKDLRSKHPSVANGLGDLIAFSKGKELTPEVVKDYRSSLKPEEFPVEYTIWDGSQRSIDKLKRDNPNEGKPQLVLNILASPEMISQLMAKPALYDLFDKVNQLSHQSGHPFVKEQIGWIRMELDPNGEYILVDEIQSDHSNATFRLKNHTNDYEITKVRNAIKQKHNIDDKELDALLVEYSNILKDFPNIASQAIVRFARQNKFKKLFWHTYESGKNLKDNEPPRSLYEKTPKDNFYLPSENKPFGLNGEFFEREAQKANSLEKLARRLYASYLKTMS